MIEGTKVEHREAGISISCFSQRSEAVRLAWLAGLMSTPVMALAPDSNMAAESAPSQRRRKPWRTAGQGRW